MTAAPGKHTPPLAGHAGSTRALVFSHDGALLAAGGDSYVLVRDVHSVEVKLRLPASVWSVAFSPDGTMLAGGCEDGDVVIWDAVSGRIRVRLPAHRGPVRSVLFSPDGRLLASGGEDGQIRLWATGFDLAPTLLGSDRVEPVWSMVFSPDGSRLAVGGDGSIEFWSPETADRLDRVAAHSGPVWSVAYAPDGDTLASGGDRSVAIWDALTRVELSRHRDPGRVWSVAFDPVGGGLASGADGSVALRDARGAERSRWADHGGPVWSLAFSPDGRTLASGADGESTVLLRNGATGAPHARPGEHKGRVSSVAFSPDGRTLISAGEDSAVVLWDADSGRVRLRLVGHEGLVSSVAITTDGTVLATAGHDANVVLWNPRSGKRLCDPLPHEGPVRAVAFSPDGALLACGGDDGTVVLREVPGGGIVRRLPHAFERPVWSVAFHPDGAILASGGGDRSIVLWDVATGQERARLHTNCGTVWSLAFSPDKTTLASAGEHCVVLWNVPSRKELVRVGGQVGNIWSLAYAPDGTLASAAEDTSIVLRDARTGAERRRLIGHTDAVWSVAYSRDGSTLASGGGRTIRVWNPRNGAQINGTGFHATRLYGRPLAGVRSDAPTTVDLLGVQPDVEMLADLIAAVGTRPPLAIALVGEWGAGKSSVMLQVEERVKYLADLSRNNPGLSLFASTVRQVPFNAWHYSDDHVWTGLVTQLFRALARDDADEEEPDLDRTRHKRQELRAQLAEREADEKRIAGKIAAADKAVAMEGALAPLGSLTRAFRVLTAAAQELCRDVVRSRKALVLWFCVVGVVAVFWLLRARLAGLISAAMLALWTAQGFLRTYRKRLERVHRFVQQASDQQYAALTERLLKAQADTVAVREQLMLVDSAVRLGAFLGTRADAAAYQQYRGLLGQVHADLETLSEELGEAREEWGAAGASTPPPLERIVLYIDDLDRCAPQRVVEVLQAVHLMLGLDLFVVVVAVDARWLIHSLQHHHRAAFDLGANEAGPASTASEGAWQVESLALPVDYLEKIFQIIYALTPPDHDDMARYMRELLPVSAAQENRGEDAGEPIPPPALAAQGTAGGGPQSPTGTVSPRRASNAPTASGEQDPRSATPIPDLRPQGLAISEAEVAFIAEISHLLLTPRAAKRLANTYRLLRIGIPEAQLPEFLGNGDGGHYQVVQILLAVLIGNPASARHIVRALADVEAESLDFLGFLDRVREESRGEQHRAERDLCIRLHVILSDLGRRVAFPLSLADYQYWCPRLARYSWHSQIPNGW